MASSRRHLRVPDRRPRDTQGARAQAGHPSSLSAIYDAAKDSDWQRVLELCRTNPNCASYQGPDGSTALHLACSQNCPDMDVFKTLLRTSPDAVLKQESKGMVPLHYACRFQASADVVRLLVRLVPGLGLASVSKRDRKGRTPLYYAEKGGAPLDVISMLREMYPDGSAVQMDDGSEREAALNTPPQTEVRLQLQRATQTPIGSEGEAALDTPPQTEPIDRRSSFYLSFLASRSNVDAVDPGERAHDSEAREDSNWNAVWASGAQGGELPPGESGFDNHEVLEQFKIMAEHEALRRVKKETGKDLEGNLESHKGGKSPGVVLVRKNKMMFKTRLPKPKRIPYAGTFAELREPSLPSFRPTPIFCGRTEQMEPEVTPGELVSGDEQVPDEQRVVRCLGCREKLSCKQNAMMVRCPNCSVESPAISTRTGMEAYDEIHTCTRNRLVGKSRLSAAPGRERHELTDNQLFGATTPKKS